MAKHRRPTSRKGAPTFLLGMAVVGAGAPLVSLLAPSTVAEAIPTVTAQAVLPLGIPEFRPDLVFQDAQQQAVKATKATARPIPTAPKIQRPPTKAPAPAVKARQTATSTPKPVPVSRPTPTVSTRPKPTVAQRQIQKATRAPVTPSKAVPRAVVPQKTQIPTQTTTTTPPKPTPRPTPTKVIPKPTVTPTVTVSIVSIARKYVGTGIPYVRGGNSLTTGMDCSHFVWMVLKEAGYKVGYRTSSDLEVWTKRVSVPQVGDLVLYTGHVGIYVGNGMMIDQGRSGGAFLRTVFKENFIGYGRMPL